MKDYILFDSNYMTPGKGKTMETVKRSVIVKDLGERDDYMEHKVILGQ